MKYFLPLESQKLTGRTLVYNEDHQAEFILLGNLTRMINSVFLTDLNRQELGRLSYSNQGTKGGYELKISGQKSIPLKNLNSKNRIYFFLAKYNYWIICNPNHGHLTIRHGFKKIAQVKTIPSSKEGPLLQITYTTGNPEVHILLSLLLTQIDFSSKKIKQPTKVTALQPSFFKLL